MSDEHAERAREIVGQAWVSWGQLKGWTPDNEIFDPVEWEPFVEVIAAALTAQAAQTEHRACPCLHTTPCHDCCTCVNTFSSSGCRRCCSYGNPDQQRAKAEHLVREAAQTRQLEQERDEAREVVARVNNSFGSYGYFTNPHPADQVENLKAESRARWRENEMLAAQTRALREALEPFATQRDAGGRLLCACELPSPPYQRPCERCVARAALTGAPREEP